MTRRDWYAVIGLMFVFMLVHDCTAAALASWPEPLPTSRPAPQAERSLRFERMTTERLSPLPSPDFAGLAGMPDVTPVSPSASSGLGRITPSPATGMRPAPSRTPRTSSSLRGTATWFRSPSGVSAAGPALRAAVGPGWRGTRVLVCAASGNCVRTVLGDYMRADRLIDLDDNVFAALAPLSRGVLTVTVRW